MATSIKQYLEDLNLDQTYVIYRISDGATYLFNKHISYDDKQVYCHVELANWYNSGVDIKVVPLNFITTLENSLSPSIGENDLVTLEGNTEHDYFVQELLIEDLDDERNSVLFMLEKFKSWKLKMDVVKMDMELKFVNLVDKGIEFLETAALTGIGRKIEINIHEIAGLVQSSNNSLEVNAWDNSIEIEYTIPNECYFETFTILFKVQLKVVRKSFSDYPPIRSFKVDKEPVVNPMAVGKSFLVAGYSDEDPNKILKVSRRPRFHQKFEKATAEAQRLANKNGGKYIVYGKLGKAFTKEAVEVDVEESE